MCGICGEIRFRGREPDLAAIHRMNDVMAPRGPDSSGAYAQNAIAVGHRRLKIMDRSDLSQQPMIDPHLGLGIVFNGAIYNHHELRRRLADDGYRFYSSGDTEVLLKAYHAWGEAMFDELQGMFAMAIWERDSGRVVLARDRLGIKPLYYAMNGDGIRFASTLPALLAPGGVDTAIDPVALHNFMSLHSIVPPPRTILAGVRKVPPASVMTFEPDGSHTQRRYWSLEFERSSEDLERSPEEWQDMIYAALERAVRRRLVADVPVGVLLSGGLDSSLIVGLISEIGQESLRTYSVGFDSVGGEEGNEFRYSDEIAERFGTIHQKIFVPESELMPGIRRAARAMSEPMMSHDVTAFFLLSERVSRDIRVVQSGQGADEVFGGYHWYPPMLASNDALEDYTRAFFDRSHDEMARAINPEMVSEDHTRAFVAEHFAGCGGSDPADKALDIDTTVMLVDDPVKRVDNMTMAFGLEARVPFLDHELVELAARVPAREKIDHGGKHVLKEAARRVLPASVIDRPKGYFPVPALKYLQGSLLEFVRDILSEPAARDRGLFQPGYVDSLMQDPESHMTPLRGSKLWQITTLELWLQTHGIH